MDRLHTQISPGFRMPEPGILPFPAVLQTAYSQKITPPQKTRSRIGHAKLNGRTPNHLRLPAPSRHAQGPGHPCQCQNYLEADVQEGLAILKPLTYRTSRQKARWAGGRAHSQSTLGLGLYGNPGMERGAPKARYHYRLRRQNDPILVAQETHDGRRHRRNAQRSHLCSFWPRQNQGQGYRVPFRQRIDLSIRSVQADVKALRHDCLPHTHQKPRIQRDSGGVLWYTQERLRLSKLPGNKPRCRKASSRLDQGLQRSSAAERTQYDITGQISFKLDIPKWEISCLKLGGAEHPCLSSISLRR